MSLEMISNYNYQYHKSNNTKVKDEKKEKLVDKLIDKTEDKVNQSTENEIPTEKSKEQQFKEFLDAFSNKDVLPEYMDLISATLSNPKLNLLVDKNYLKNLNNEDTLKKYRDTIDELSKIDKMADQWYKNSNVEVVSRGWLIDKNGNISHWSITRTKVDKNKKRYEYLNAEKLEKIRKQKKEKKKKLEKIRKEKKENEEQLEKLREKKEKQKNKVTKSQVKNASHYNSAKLHMIANILNKTV